jgi:hypothetical protein
VLKPFDQVTVSDERYRFVSGRTGLPITAAEHHDWVATITLCEAAPAEVVEAFDRARNAFVYSWFVCELASLAEAQALFSLEFALRLRLGFAAGAKGPSLQALLTRAVAVGVLRLQTRSDPESQDNGECDSG